MKFDISHIVYDYIKVIRGDKWSFSSSFDVLFVFVLPISGAVSTYWYQDGIEQNLYLSLFTLFGVFVAVFMTMLGVMVPLYHAPRRKSDELIVDQRLKSEHDIKIDVIREVSTILCYLTLFAILIMSITMIPLATNSKLFLFKWISIGSMLHMGLNLLILMKRIHILIQYEFNPNS